MDENSENKVKSFGIVEQPVAVVPSKVPPVGHALFMESTYHGQFTVTLTALEPVHVGTGVGVMGQDVGSSAPLVRPMTQQTDGTLIIPGTSLKGCLRSMYEAITPSTLGAYSAGIPFEFKPSNYSRRNRDICPASHVFGAMGYQGLLSVGDAVCDTPAELGEIPLLYSPKKPKAQYPDHLPRRFYRALHTRPVADDGDTPKTATAQWAPVGANFTTELRFKNLTLEAIGLLLIVLGQHSDYPLSLKLGAAKGYGFGTLTATVVNTTVYSTEALTQNRYQSYSSKKTSLDEETLMVDALTAACRGTLLQESQLNQLCSILPNPTQDVSNE